MIKRLTYPIIIFLMLVGLSKGGETLYILHTNNTNGTLENCYCPDHPLGSVEKRSVFVREFISEHPNTIVVDAGDFFSVTARQPYKDSLVCVAYGFIPYDAILLGDQEIVRGEDYLNRILPRTGAGLVATNLKSPRPMGVMPYKIITRGNLRIGILGVISPQALKYYPPDIREAIALKAPLEAINETLPEIIEATDIIVVLSHQGYDPDVKLASQLDHVAVIIGGHSQAALKNPSIENGILVAQAGKEGYYVGVIEIKLNDRKEVVSQKGWLEPMKLEMPDDPRVMKLIKDYEEQSGLINRNKLKQQKTNGTDN